jgi:AcrR family transcriptional regulator
MKAMPSALMKAMSSALMEDKSRPVRGQKATPLRQDAQIRRERLIEAAVALFFEEGIDVPLERIAARAKVGRATLYRNFPDRAALTAAILQIYLDSLRSEVEKCSDRMEAFFAGIRSLARLTIAAHGFEKIQRMAPAVQAAFRKEMEDILAEPLARAKEAGVVRLDFELMDIPRVALMVAGGGLHQREGDTEAAINRALELLLQGLAPRPATKAAAVTALALPPHLGGRGGLI